MDDTNQAPLTVAQLHGKAKLPWTLDAQGSQAVHKGQGILGLSTGLFATVPIICRGPKCPYVNTCICDDVDRRVGERCPMEIAAIVTRFEQYCEALNVTDKDLVDMSLVRELVDIEVQILRADALLAKDANFIEYVVAGVSEDGTPYYKPEIHKSVESKNNLRKERHRILQLLNSTRKDREGNKAQDPSTMAAAILAKARELEKQGALKAAPQTEAAVKPEQE